MKGAPGDLSAQQGLEPLLSLGREKNTSLLKNIRCLLSHSKVASMYQLHCMTSGASPHNAATGSRSEQMILTPSPWHPKIAPVHAADHRRRTASKLCSVDSAYLEDDSA